MLGTPERINESESCFSTFNVHGNHLGSFLNASSDSIGLVWDPKDYISNKLLGNVHSLKCKELEDRFEKCDPVRQRNRKYLFE